MSKILCTTLAFILVDCSMASAAFLEPRGDTKPPLILIANGCGPGLFRTMDGECVPNRRIRVGGGRAVVGPPPCPRGFLRDPDPARRLCYPVY